MSNYLREATNPAKIPQSEPLNDRQVENSAGGFTFTIDDFGRLRRFLVLGSEGGSYYATERKLTTDNIDAVKRAIKSDGPRVVRDIVAVSDAGLAPKNDPALFCLALCASAESAATRAVALAALPQVARIGTHLLHFADFVDGQRGWGRGLRNAVGNWFNEKPVGKLAYQAIKYQSRDKWALRDLLRLSHPKSDGNRGELYKWIVDGWEGIGEIPHPDADLRIVWAHERAKTADVKEIVDLITTYGLPMESIPTDKRTREIYEALIPMAGLTWLIRNLGNLSKCGAVATGQYSALNAVTARITDVEQIRKGRIHPLALLVALNTYKSGKSVKGSGEWPIVSKIVDALDSAFYLAFKAIEPTGKRFVLGMDISGSMDQGEIAGMAGISPRVGCAAMAMVTNAIEPNCAAMAFTGNVQTWPQLYALRENPTAAMRGFVPFELSAKDRLDAVAERMRRMSMGATDCAMPMLWATKNNIEADAFVIYTDNETWAGGVHPTVALNDYRQKMGIDARLIVVGMTATEFTVADPSDADQLDLVGFDSSAPMVISEFAAGRI